MKGRLTWRLFIFLDIVQQFLDLVLIPSTPLPMKTVTSTFSFIQNYFEQTTQLSILQSILKPLGSKELFMNTLLSVSNSISNLPWILDVSSFSSLLFEWDVLGRWEGIEFLYGPHLRCPFRREFDRDCTHCTDSNHECWWSSWPLGLLVLHLPDPLFEPQAERVRLQDEFYDASYQSESIDSSTDSFVTFYFLGIIHDSLLLSLLYCRHESHL